MDDLKPILEKKLEKINDSLESVSERSATTIACAIVGKDKTLITSIGDTRIYFIKDGKITSKTEDDSYVQTLCNKGLADPKKARFHKAINFVSEELGNVIKYFQIILN